MTTGRRILVLAPPVPVGWQAVLAAAVAVAARRLGWTVELDAIGVEGISFRPDSGVAGIVAAIYSHEVADSLASLGRPVVNVDGALADLPYPRVGVDPAAVARLACEHFLQLGCPELAVVGIQGRRSSTGLMDAFIGCAQAAGIPSHRLAMPHLWRAPVLGVRASRQADHLLQAFLRRRAPGCGLLVWGDHGARIVAGMLGRDRLVDGSFRLVSSNDDPLLAETEVPISAVRADPAVVAERAVALLLRQIDGAQLAGTVELVPPAELVARASSCGPGPGTTLARVLARLRSDLDRSISIEAVAAEVGLQRRTLERIIRRELGRSPLAVRQEARLARARALLASGMDMGQTATACGYSRAQTLRRLIDGGVRATP